MVSSLLKINNGVLFRNPISVDMVPLYSRDQGLFKDLPSHYY